MTKNNVTLRLHYFPFAGRAAAIRDALRIGGIPFEDAHIAPEQFFTKRAAGETRFAALPAMDIETPQGVVSTTQSNAILRYVGRLTGLYPVDDALRALKVDEALDLGEDMNQAIGPSITEKNAERRMEMRKALAEERLPRLGGVLERLLMENGNTGFVVGDALTVADLKLYWMVDKLTNGTLDGIPKSLFDRFPAIGAWRKNIAAVREAHLAAIGK